MRTHDFDPALQRVFSTAYVSMPRVDWRRWLTISSPEEFEEAALDASGLFAGSLEGIAEHPSTPPRQIAVDIATLAPTPSRPIVACHTSGTSGGAVKWFHMTMGLVRRLWAPGMQAIFESSGVTRTARVVVFVPSRLQGDGLTVEDGAILCRLYSAEFSQRLMLAMLRPAVYLLDVYRASRSLTTLARLLSMERIDVVSAPAATILGWADPRRLRRGLSRSYRALRARQDTVTGETAHLLERIRTVGVDAAAIEVQRRLNALFTAATLVFSTSSLTAPEWTTIRGFMGWSLGAERFTNLYVGSEVGPFAATLRRHPDDPIGHDAMAVFPLTLPAIRRRGAVQLLSRCDTGRGRLLVSRVHVGSPVYNLDSGDVVQVMAVAGAPMIAGEILRDAFPLRVAPTVTLTPATPRRCAVYVGGYFDLGALEIVNPRRLQACLAEKCHVTIPVSVLYPPGLGDSWTWRFSVQGSCRVSTPTIERVLASCPEGAPLASVIRDGALRIEVDHDLTTMVDRSRGDRLRQVGAGMLPKGVLKRWPLYLLKPVPEGQCGHRPTAGKSSSQT